MFESSVLERALRIEVLAPVHRPGAWEIRRPVFRSGYTYTVPLYSCSSCR